MSSINLRYGKSSIEFEFDENRFDVLGEMRSQPRLSDIEIGERFDAPIGSEMIEDIIRSGKVF